MKWVGHHLVRFILCFHQVIAHPPAYYLTLMKRKEFIRIIALFPPKSAVEGIKSVLSVHPFVCEHSHGRTIWHIDIKFTMVFAHSEDKVIRRDYPHLPMNYRHTDKHLRVVMTLVALCCTRQSRAPNIDNCASENRPWPLTLTHDLDPDLWPWTLTLTPTFALDPDLWPWP